MELLKRNIHTNRVKCSNMIQLTLDDDFNVPDSKPDVERIVKEQGSVAITEVVPMNGRFQVKGKLIFNLLYISEDRERPVHHITGEVPFEEVVNMDEVCGEEAIAVKWELEDMNASLINSRKLNVRAILVLHFRAESACEEETAVGIEGDAGLQARNKTIHITNAPIVKKDTLRVKDEVSLPLGKPNIEDLLYTNLELRNIEACAGRQTFHQRRPGNFCALCRRRTGKPAELLGSSCAGQRAFGMCRLPGRHGGRYRNLYFVAGHCHQAG